jgi:dCMP deaminase
MLINAGIRKIYYEEGYEDALSDQMFAEAGVEVARLKI